MVQLPLANDRRICAKLQYVTHFAFKCFCKTLPWIVFVRRGCCCFWLSVDDRSLGHHARAEASSRTMPNAQPVSTQRCVYMCVCVCTVCRQKARCTCVLLCYEPFLSSFFHIYPLRLLSTTLAVLSHCPYRPPGVSRRVKSRSYRHSGWTDSIYRCSMTKLTDCTSSHFCCRWKVGCTTRRIFALATDLSVRWSKYFIRSCCWLPATFASSELCDAHTACRFMHFVFSLFTEHCTSCYSMFTLLFNYSVSARLWSNYIIQQERAFCQTRGLS